MRNEAFGRMVMVLLKRRYYRELHTSLKHYNAVDLFVAVLLSPQCSDEQVNRATSRLFRKFRNFSDYANAGTTALMKELRGINFYRTKARHLKASARLIVEKHKGKVPDTLAELIELPGVGRKVANVLLNELYGIDDGIAVDTHCIVTSNRLGLARSNDPVKVEGALMRKLPKKYWGIASNLLIALGRDTCTARKKECERCVLKRICPSSTAGSRGS